MFFYIIQDRRNLLYYAGSSTSKRSNPDTFMTERGYKTSSKIINSIIKEHGLEVFIIRKIKIFDERQKAYEYETRFLKKVKASTNPLFYNKHENEGKIIFGSDKYKSLMMELYGAPHISLSNEFGNLFRKGMNKKYGVDHPMQIDQVKKKLTATNVDRYGVNWPMQNPEIRTKSLETCNLLYGCDNPMQNPEIRSKAMKTSLQRYGAENPFASEFIKNKIASINLERYGHKNAMQNETIKRKVFDQIMENNDKRYSNVIKVILQIYEEGSLDFTKKGWQSELSKLINVNITTKWLLRNMPDFYDKKCWKRAPKKSNVRK